MGVRGLPSDDRASASELQGLLCVLDVNSLRELEMVPTDPVGFRTLLPGLHGLHVGGGGPGGSPAGCYLATFVLRGSLSFCSRAVLGQTRPCSVAGPYSSAPPSLGAGASPSPAPRGPHVHM